MVSSVNGVPVNFKDYDQLEELNLAIISEFARGEVEYARSKRLQDLEHLRGLHSVVVCFCDLAGRLHLLEYDRKHIVDSYENLTFDGSSIQGFTPQKESDLRLELDWTSFRYVPDDVFGGSKVLMFAFVKNQDGTPFGNDFRGILSSYVRDLKEAHDYVPYVGTEIEGFLFQGREAEQLFDESKGFVLPNNSIYFNSLPLDTLRVFIDRCIQAFRALGFRGEKSHAEVAPSQYEMNFRYATPVETGDRVHLYKLTARVIANQMGCTASFLPKPFTNLNGTGMHTNVSVAQGGRNLFWAGNGHGLSEQGIDFACGVLERAFDSCLIFNSSVNAFRRLDPHKEAPNEVKMSECDRGSMVRIPIGNEHSSRIECRTLSPDVNPYLAFYTIFKCGIENMIADEAVRKHSRDVLLPASDGSFKKLPGSLSEAIGYFEKSSFMSDVMTSKAYHTYLNMKKIDAARCPALLGNSIKNQEIRLHHEVATQLERERF